MKIYTKNIKEPSWNLKNIVHKRAEHRLKLYKFLTEEMKSVIYKIQDSGGDLSCLTTEEMKAYYLFSCDKIGLPPEIFPLGIWKDESNGRQGLYLTKEGFFSALSMYKISFVSTNTTLVSIGRDGTQVCISVVYEDQSGRKEEDISSAYFSTAIVDPSANDIGLKTARTNAEKRCVLKLIGVNLSEKSEINEFDSGMEVSSSKSEFLLENVPVDELPKEDKSDESKNDFNEDKIPFEDKIEMLMGYAERKGVEEAVKRANSFFKDPSDLLKASQILKKHFIDNIKEPELS